jgi:hypothetical protein
MFQKPFQRASLIYCANSIDASAGSSNRKSPSRKRWRFSPADAAMARAGV